MRPLALFVAALAALVLFARPASAAPAALVEFVNVDVKEHEVDMHVKTSLREAVVATGATPTMPPRFSREELEGVLQRFAPYLVEHVHVLARGRALPGKIAATKLLDAPDAGADAKTGLEDAHGQVDLVFEIGTTDPLTLSFDVLGDKQDAPGGPFTVLYSVDVHGPHSQHADLAQGTTTTFDVVEASIPAERGAPRVGSGRGARRGPPLGSAALGLAIFAGILYIGWSVVKKRLRR